MYNLEDGDKFYFIEYKDYISWDDIDNLFYDNSFDDFLTELHGKYLSKNFLYYTKPYDYVSYSTGTKLNIECEDVIYDRGKIRFMYRCAPIDKDRFDNDNFIFIFYSFYFPRVSRGDGKSVYDNYASYSFDKACFSDTKYATYSDCRYGELKSKDDKPLAQILPQIEDFLSELIKHIGIRHVIL